MSRNGYSNQNIGTILSLGNTMLSSPGKNSLWWSGSPTDLIAEVVDGEPDYQKFRFSQHSGQKFELLRDPFPAYNDDDDVDDDNGDDDDDDNDDDDADDNDDDEDDVDDLDDDDDDNDDKRIAVIPRE